MRGTATPITKAHLMKQYLEFESLKDAREYRHAHGTGGWIFTADKTSVSTLFPPEMCPSEILNHRLTRGQSGYLTGHP